MTNEEAKDLLDNLIGMVEDNQHNDYDEALKLGIEAIEKQIPKKPIIKTNAYDYKFYKCPNCGIDIEHVIFSPYMYCHKCGQKIDKSEVINNDRAD